jgi:hypothetical protein
LLHTGFKYINYSKNEDPYGNENQIGVVEYINETNGDSIKIVSDLLIKSFGNSEHKKCSIAFKEVLENSIKDLSELNCVEYLCMLNEDPEFTIEEISFFKKDLSKIKVVYTVECPYCKKIAVRIIFVKDDHFVQLKKVLEVPKLQEIFQESKPNDEFDYHLYMNKIKKDSSLQKLIESSVQELSQEFAI